MALGTYFNRTSYPDLTPNSIFGEARSFTPWLLWATSDFSVCPPTYICL